MSVATPDAIDNPSVREVVLLIRFEKTTPNAIPSALNAKNKKRIALIFIAATMAS